MTHSAFRQTHTTSPIVAGRPGKAVLRWLIALSLCAGCATTGRDTARVEPTLARPGRGAPPPAIIPVAATGQPPQSPPTIVPPFPGAASGIAPAGPLASAPLSVQAAPVGAVPFVATPVSSLPAALVPLALAGPTTGSSFVPAGASGAMVAGPPPTQAQGLMPNAFGGSTVAAASPHALVVSGFLSGADISALGLRLHPKLPPPSGVRQLQPPAAPE